MKMVNLRVETERRLKENGKTWEDVKFVTNGSSSTAQLNFQELADFEYDGGYGGANIDSQLKVVGDDWWLERHEYDGCEWWEFKTLPKDPGNSKGLFTRKSIMEDKEYGHDCHNA